MGRLGGEDPVAGRRGCDHLLGFGRLALGGLCWLARPGRCTRSMWPARRRWLWLAEDLHRSTCLFDRLPGAVAEGVRRDVQLALEAAGTEHLDVQAGSHEARFEERLRVDLGPIAEPAQLGDVDDGVDLLEWVLEPGQLGDALRERHLATLEAQAEAFAACVLAFLATSGGLAATGSGAAADPPRRAVRTRRRLQVM